MATSIAAIAVRIAAVLQADPFQFTPAVTPFDFSKSPTSVIDQLYRMEIVAGPVIGGFNYSEEHTDRVTVHLARKIHGDAQAVYAQLLDDQAAVRAAVIRDGVSGDYFVPDDGAEFEVQHPEGAEYAVLRMSLPVNYEVSV